MCYADFCTETCKSPRVQGWGECGIMYVLVIILGGLYGILGHDK